MKILVAEDSEPVRKLVAGYVAKWGYEPIEAQDGVEAWGKILSDDQINICIIDWMMPQMDGIELIKKIRGLQDRRYTFIIILTAKEEREDVVEGFEAGADDYIKKPFHPLELKSRIGVGVRILSLETRLLEALNDQKEIARTDALTGLMNRGAILEKLKEEREHNRREGTPLGVVMGDIDRFKRINDELGHIVGDKILKHTAENLKNSLRIYDSVGRFGGEEFLLLLPNADKEEAIEVADRVREYVAANPSRVNGSENLIVTISFGVTVVYPEDLSDITQVIAKADKALYASKEGGRNRVSFQE